MRHTKFRGKSLVTDKWTYGGLIENQGWFFIHYTTSEMIIKDSDSGHTTIVTVTAGAVDGSTVGQFTGLLDKNDKEIYEGDIVNIHDSHETCGVIEYRNRTAAFVLCRDKVKNRHKGDGIDYQLYAGRQKRYEIIGNIYDNPELLKGGEK